MLLSLLGDSDVHRQLISMCLCWCWRCATAAATLSMQLLLCEAQRLAPSCWMADCSTAAHRYFFRLWPRKNTVCCFGRRAYTVQAALQAPDSNAGLSPASAAVKLARGAGLTWPGCCEQAAFPQLLAVAVCVLFCDGACLSPPRRLARCCGCFLQGHGPVALHQCWWCTGAVSCRRELRYIAGRRV